MSKVAYTCFMLVALTASMHLVGCGGKKEATARRDARYYLEKADLELSKRHCLKAAEHYRKVVVNFPGSHLVDDAQFGLGEARFCSKDYTEAIFEYHRLMNEYPNSSLAPTAQYMVAKSYANLSNNVHLDQSDTQKAISEFRRFIEDYPDLELTADAEEMLSELNSKLAAKVIEIADNYMKWGYPRAAQVYYQRVLEFHNDTPWAGNAKLGLAMVKARKGEVEQALIELRQLLSDGVQPSIEKRAQEELKELRKKNSTSQKGMGTESSTKGRSSGGGIRSDP